MKNTIYDDLYNDLKPCHKNKNNFVILLNMLQVIGYRVTGYRLRVEKIILLRNKNSKKYFFYILYIITSQI